MSENLPKQPVPEEVDLGKVFFYIEKGFKKIGELFVNIYHIFKWVLTKVLILLLIILNTLKKHIIKVGISGILTFVLFHFLDSKSEPIYQSNIIIKQNYSTGKVLYGSILRYNLLVSDRDSVGLGKELGIPSEVAANLSGFEIVNLMNENDLFEKYFNFIQNVDSTSTITYLEFKEDYDIENFPFQAINVFSKDPTSFDNLSNSFVKSFEENEFFIEEREQEKDLILNKIKANQDILIKSYALQEQYVDLLENYYGAIGSEDTKETTLNINMSNTKERVDTKEYELFEDQNKIKLGIVELENEIKQKDQIIRLQKNFSPPILVKNVYEENKYSATFIVMSLVLLLFLIKEFNPLGIIDKYGRKENLLD